MAAVSYGIPERRIMMRYLLKPSLIPMVSILGMEIARSIGGSFIIESIFSWPGFGKYGMSAMLMKDLNPIIASVMLMGLSTAFFNIVVDVIVAYLDPRIRVMERST
jgi:peptide/nickel transport system permease protein